MLNIAVLAPMPKARVSTEITANPGVFKSERVPCRTSCHTLSMIDLLEPEVHVQEAGRCFLVVNNNRLITLGYKLILCLHQRLRFKPGRSSWWAQRYLPTASFAMA